jgi:hypothetical protein
MNAVLRGSRSTPNFAYYPVSSTPPQGTTQPQGGTELSPEKLAQPRPRVAALSVGPKDRLRSVKLFATSDASPVQPGLKRIRPGWPRLDENLDPLLVDPVSRALIEFLREQSELCRQGRFTEARWRITAARRDGRFA